MFTFVYFIAPMLIGCTGKIPSRRVQSVPESRAPCRAWGLSQLLEPLRHIGLYTNEAGGMGLEFICICTESTKRLHHGTGNEAHRAKAGGRGGASRRVAIPSLSVRHTSSRGLCFM
jgi:hypothetical protein